VLKELFTESHFQPITASHLAVIRVFLITAGVELHNVDLLCPIIDITTSLIYYRNRG